MRKSKSKFNALLDSKLILETSKKCYDVKLVECGDYIQLYLYGKKKVKNIDDDNNDLNLKAVLLNSKNSKGSKDNSNSLKEIEFRNIIRSKLECQRMAKSNIGSWKTFITLTFKENITEVNDAMYQFKKFVIKVRRIKKDFMYLCITEFQKRGAVHFHILTNIDIDDESLMYRQEDNKNFVHIKYWNDGFTSVEPLNGNPKKIIGYISKYMTKDIDNRLFNKHRYFYSRNLNKPKESFIDLDNNRERDYYIKKTQGKELIYQNEYINTYDDSTVKFLEFLTHNDIL